MIMTADRPAGIRSVPPRKLRYVVAAAGVLVLVAVWVVAFSPLLGARTVSVVGTPTLTSAQVTQVRTAAAISRGTALIRLDTGAVRKRVEKLPDVASAAVTVSYPSTVRIKVTERVPVGYLANTGTGGSSFVLVDASGAQYREVAAAPAGLPRFALPSDSGAAATGHAVSLVAAALSPAVLAQLAQISADTPQAITLVLRDGRTVAWGSADRNAQKAALLPALLTQPGTNIDVSNPDVAVVR
jgi:cell division protein FtsQ